MAVSQSSKHGRVALALEQPYSFLASLECLGHLSEARNLTGIGACWLASVVAYFISKIISFQEFEVGGSHSAICLERDCQEFVKYAFAAR